MSQKILKILLLAVILFTGCEKEQTGQKDDAVDPKAVPVVLAEVVKADMVRRMDFVGSIAPWQQAALGSQVSGKVEKIFVEVGDRVAEGDMLIQMSDEQLIQSRANLIALEKDWQRLKGLKEKGTVTQQAFDKVDAAYQAAKAGYEMMLTNTQIRAPFAGRITAKYYEEGEVFTPMSGRVGKPAILELMDLSKLKVIISIPEKDLPEFRRGLDVFLSVDAYPEAEFKAVVNRVDPTVDPRSRMGSAELKIDHPQEKLKPGMFARIGVILETRKGVLTVPTECVIHENNEDFVFLIDQQMALKRLVNIGLQNGEITEIIEGLELADPVIRVGQRVVKSGQPILIVEPAASEERVER